MWLARTIASSSKERWPCREQNCLGTAVPLGVVVKARRQLPLPAASTKAQTCSVFDIANSKEKVRQHFSICACASRPKYLTVRTSSLKYTIDITVSEQE